MSDVSLIFPPGWILNCGGPHLGLPLIKSYLERRQVTTTILDANLGAVQFWGLELSNPDSWRLDEYESLSELNRPYYQLQNQLDNVLESNGSLDIQEGYQPNGYRYSNPELVREFSKGRSPYTEYYEQELMPTILRDTPKVVGLSLTVPAQVLPAFELCRKIRSVGFRGTILLGGNLIPRIGGDMKLDWIFDLVDGLVYYQGEETIFQIAKAIEHGFSWSEIPNLVWRDEFGVFQQNKRSTLQKEDFCQPDFHGFPIGEYWGVNYLPVILSRGCYYGRCKFCAIPFSWGNNGFIGHDSPLRVADFMQSSIAKYGICKFKFVDESLHPGILKQLCQIIVDREINCQFEGYARLDKLWLDDETLRLFSRAGLRKVYVGLELVDSSGRDYLEKGDSANSALEFLEKMKDHGILVHLFTMAGFPGTSEDQAIGTIRFALEHRSLIDTLDIFPFYYARGTEVDGVEIVCDETETWTVEYDFRPTSKDVMNQQDVEKLAHAIENLLWSEEPQWLHPTYRLLSPWLNHQAQSIHKEPEPVF